MEQTGVTMCTHLFVRTLFKSINAKNSSSSEILYHLEAERYDADLAA